MYFYLQLKTSSCEAVCEAQKMRWEQNEKEKKHPRPLPIPGKHLKQFFQVSSYTFLNIHKYIYLSHSTNTYLHKDHIRVWGMVSSSRCS